MVTAKCKVGDGDFACVGKGGAEPRSNLNPLGVTSDERFEIEYSSRGSIDQKPLLGRANANFDDGKAVAPFDGDLVGGSGLREKRGREKRHRKQAHDEDSSVHLTNYRPLDANTGSQVTCRAIPSQFFHRFSPCSREPHFFSPSLSTLSISAKHVSRSFFFSSVVARILTTL